MKGSIIPLIVLASVSSLTSAASFVARDRERRSYGGMLQLDVERVKRSNVGLSRRDTVSVGLENYEDVAYLATIGLGSPSQTLKVQLDTGSSDLWVQASTNPYCAAMVPDCEHFGTFNAAASSTFSELQDSPFSISYVDTTAAQGTYATDTLQIGNATVDNFVFGYAEYSNSSVPVLGVSFTLDEESKQVYPNMPYRLKQDGTIDIVAYSLWLNDIEASEGSILFGGIDKGKFAGELSVIPMYPALTSQDTEYFAYFNVTLTGISVKSSSSANSDETVVYGTSDALVTASGTIYTVLDSGTSLGTFPLSILQGIVDALGLSSSAEYHQDYGYYEVDCSLMTSSPLVVFEFGGKASIAVPMENFVQVAGENTCMIAVQASESLDQYSESYIVGDTVLRSAYVVYDLDNRMIGLAQTSFNSSVTDLYSLSSSGIPDGLIGTGTDSPENVIAESSSSASTTSASFIATATNTMSVTNTVIMTDSVPADLTLVSTIAPTPVSSTTSSHSSTTTTATTGSTSSVPAGSAAGTNLPRSSFAVAMLLSIVLVLAQS
ncbi:aspartic peptidase domain-containing protein [Lipomyces orientalis]|uniref:Aspartic peptidase domain-containing protein n=1 Tax=Lipomyces orientalis TaxID=1233043 RepID=A0ACC3TER8_9ASCO